MISNSLIYIISFKVGSDISGGGGSVTNTVEITWFNQNNSLNNSTFDCALKG